MQKSISKASPDSAPWEQPGNLETKVPIPSCKGYALRFRPKHPMFEDAHTLSGSSFHNVGASKVKLMANQQERT